MLLNAARKFPQQLVTQVIPIKNIWLLVVIERSVPVPPPLLSAVFLLIMKLIKTFQRVCLISLLLGAIGCSGKINYHIGIVTHSVTGKIERESAATYQSETFILVKEYVRTFMSTSDGDLHRIAAKIVKADKKGNYNISYDSDVSKLDLFYLSEGHLIDSESFKKTLFIGSYEYNMRLKTDSDYRNSYYLVIKPMLVELITEPRYRLSITDQIFLKNWMNQMDDLY
ncbi:MAG: hypothetical protein HOC24_10835 [Deltaproteobacteria bacterium]|jgi:hypothetical protein|nr:hypothetical protein [Deltaproteobacteria bacterium]